MNTPDTLDRMLGDWFATDAAAPAPAELMDRVAATTVGRTPRSGWLAGLRGHWVGAHDTTAAERRPVGTRRLGTMLLIALLTAVLLGTAVLVGSRGDTPAPTTMIPAERGAFRLLAPMLTEHRGNSATLLSDGRVLIVGSMSDGREAEAWNPATEAFSPAGKLGAGRVDPSGILLSDGRVLIVGGFNDSDSAAQAEIWDPVTNTFAPAGSLAYQRGHPTLTLQPDGGVLVSGGVKVSGEYVVPDDTAEAWDPASTTFSPADPVAAVPHGARLQDGRVLVIADDSAALWDPITRSTEPTSPLTVARGKDISPYGIRPSATTLADGRVLVVGGTTCEPIEGEQTASLTVALSGCSVEAIDSAEIFDPGTNEFSVTGAPSVGRAQHTATLLLDGRVLVVGGYGYGAATAELFELQ